MGKSDEGLTKENEVRETRSRYSASFKSIAAFVVAAFLLQDIVYAQGGTALWSQVQEAKAQTSAEKKDESAFSGKIIIPYDSGLTRKVVINGTNEVIINIQDAHQKLGAQESITRILDNLVKNYNLNLITLEGASDLIDTSLIKSFPIDEVKERAGEFLLKEGRIGAGTFYSIISESRVGVYGVEDPALYEENLEVFRGLIEKKIRVRKELKGLKRALKELEEKIYSEELRDLTERKLLQRNGDIKFTDYWQHFSGLAKAKGVDYAKYPNLKKLAATVDLEKEIDFRKATTERDRLIEELGRKLPKPELEKLVLTSLQYKQNKVTPGSFHYYLAQLAHTVELDPMAYKNVILYSQYVVLYEDIDLIAIFDEVENFENELREKLFTTEDERTLSNLSHCAMVLSQLLDTTLTSKDYEFYVANESACEIENIQKTIESLYSRFRGNDNGNGNDIEKLVDFEFLKEAIPNARKFYELATRRNQVLLQNTLKRMRAEKVQVAALITGGFHSEGISQLMDEEKLSYLVVMPKFDDKSPDRPYIAILTQKPKEYEDAFKGSDFYLAAPDEMDLANKTSDPLRTLALVGVGARLAGLTLSDEIKTRYLDEYGRRHVELKAAGKEGFISPEELADRLAELTVQKQGGAYTVNFRNKVFWVMPGKEGGIEDLVEGSKAPGARLAAAEPKFEVRPAPLTVGPTLEVAQVYAADAEADGFIALAVGSIRSKYSARKLDVSLEELENRIVSEVKLSATINARKKGKALSDAQSEKALEPSLKLAKELAPTVLRAAVAAPKAAPKPAPAKPAPPKVVPAPAPAPALVVEKPAPAAKAPEVPIALSRSEKLKMVEAINKLPSDIQPKVIEAIIAFEAKGSRLSFSQINNIVRLAGDPAAPPAEDGSLVASLRPLLTAPQGARLAFGPETIPLRQIENPIFSRRYTPEVQKVFDEIAEEWRYRSRTVVETAPAPIPPKEALPQMTKPVAPTPSFSSRLQSLFLSSVSAVIVTSVFTALAGTTFWAVPIVAVVMGAVGYLRAPPEKSPLAGQTIKSHNDIDGLAGDQKLSLRAKIALVWMGLKKIDRHVQEAKHPSAQEPLSRKIYKWVGSFVLAGAAVTAVFTLWIPLGVGIFFAVAGAAFMLSGILVNVGFEMIDAVREEGGIVKILFGAGLGGLGKGLFHLFIGLPYHLFRGFVLGIFEGKIAAYWFPLLSYAGHILANGTKSKNFIDYLTDYTLAWHTDDEIKAVVNLERKEISEEAGTSKTYHFFHYTIGKSAGFLITKLLFESLLLGGAFEFLKKRSVLMVAGFVGGQLLPLVGLGLTPFILLAGTVAGFMVIRAAVQITSAYRSGEVENFRRFAAWRILTAVLVITALVGLGFLGLQDANFLTPEFVLSHGELIPYEEAIHISFEGGFNVLDRGFTVITPQIGQIGPQTIFFTVRAFASSAATLLILNLKQILPAMKLELLKMLNESIRKGIEKETWDKFKNPRTGMLIDSFSIKSLRAFVDLLIETPVEGEHESADRSKILRVLYRTLNTRLLNRIGFSGLSGYEVNIAKNMLEESPVFTEEDKKIAASTYSTLADAIPRAFFLGAFKTFTSPRFWGGIVMGVPGMWFMQTEIAIVVGASEMTGLEPLAKAVKVIEGSHADQERIAAMEGRGYEISFADRIASGGALGIANNLWLMASHGVTGYFAPKEAPVAPVAEPRGEEADRLKEEMGRMERKRELLEKEENEAREKLALATRQWEARRDALFGKVDELPKDVVSAKDIVAFEREAAKLRDEARTVGVLERFEELVAAKRTEQEAVREEARQGQAEAIDASIAEAQAKIDDLTVKVKPLEDKEKEKSGLESKKQTGWEYAPEVEALKTRLKALTAKTQNDIERHDARAKKGEALTAEYRDALKSYGVVVSEDGTSYLLLKSGQIWDVRFDQEGKPYLMQEGKKMRVVLGLRALSVARENLDDYYLETTGAGEELTQIKRSREAYQNRISQLSELKKRVPHQYFSHYERQRVLASYSEQIAADTMSMSQLGERERALRNRLYLDHKTYVRKIDTHLVPLNEEIRQLKALDADLARARSERESLGKRSAAFVKERENEKSQIKAEAKKLGASPEELDEADSVLKLRGLLAKKIEEAKKMDVGKAAAERGALKSLRGDVEVKAKLKREQADAALETKMAYLSLSPRIFGGIRLEKDSNRVIRVGTPYGIVEIPLGEHLYPPGFDFKYAAAFRAKMAGGKIVIEQQFMDLNQISSPEAVEALRTKGYYKDPATGYVYQAYFDAVYTDPDTGRFLAGVRRGRVDYRGMQKFDVIATDEFKQKHSLLHWQLLRRGPEGLVEVTGRRLTKSKYESKMRELSKPHLARDTWVVKDPKTGEYWEWIKGKYKYNVGIQRILVPDASGSIPNIEFFVDSTGKRFYTSPGPRVLRGSGAAFESGGRDFMNGVMIARASHNLPRVVDPYLQALLLEKVYVHGGIIIDVPGDPPKILFSEDGKTYEAYRDKFEEKMTKVSGEKERISLEIAAEEEKPLPDEQKLRALKRERQELEKETQRGDKLIWNDGEVSYTLVKSPVRAEIEAQAVENDLKKIDDRIAQLDTMLALREEFKKPGVPAEERRVVAALPALSPPPVEEKLGMTVAREKGHPVRFDVDYLAITTNHKPVKLLPKGDDPKKEYKLTTGAGWGDTWIRWDAVQGDTPSFVDVRAPDGKPSFYLTGSVAVQRGAKGNLEPIENLKSPVDEKGVTRLELDQPLAPDDKIYADFITVVLRDERGHLTGSITIELKGRGGFALKDIHAKASQFFKSDVAQRINVGQTTAEKTKGQRLSKDQQFVVSRYRIYDRNAWPSYSERLDYHDANMDLRYVVYGDARLKIYPNKSIELRRDPSGKESKGEVEIVDSPGKSRFFSFDTSKDLALTEAGTAEKLPEKITMEGRVYSVVVRKDKDGGIEKVFAVDAAGREAVRYTLRRGDQWEAQYLKTGDVYAAAPPTFKIGEKIAATRDDGRTVSIKGAAYSLKERISKTGVVEKVFAMDEKGKERVRYYTDISNVTEAEIVETRKEGDTEINDIYSTGGKAENYALKAKIGEVKTSGQKAALGGKDYYLKIRYDLKGDIERVYAADRFGREVIRYYVDSEGRFAEAEDIETGKIYRVDMGEPYALREQIALIELKGAVDFKGSRYNLFVRKSMSGKEERAFVVDGVGREVVRFHTHPEGRYEAEDVETGDIYLSDADHQVPEGTAPIAKTKKLPQEFTIDGKSYAMKARVHSKTNAVEKEFAYDGAGFEVAAFYPKPQEVKVDGRVVKVKGYAVVNQGKTIDEAIPNAAEVKKAHGYTGKEAARNIYYYDADFRVLKELGQKGLKGYSIKTGNKVQGEDWTVWEEIDTDGRFVTARANDSMGFHVATLSKLPEGGYIIEVVNKPSAKAKERGPDRVAHGAKKEKESYLFTERAVRTSYIGTFEVKIVRGAEGKLGVADLDNVLQASRGIPSALQGVAREKLTQGLLKIAQNLGREEGPIELVKTEVRNEKGGASFYIRVKDDPFGRELVFFTGERDTNVVVNTAWADGKSVEGYEFSASGLYIVETEEKPFTDAELMQKYGLSKKIMRDLRVRGLLKGEISLSKSNKYLLVNNEKILFSSRYMTRNDPLLRTYAIEDDRGYIRFITWSADAVKNVPFGVAPGEVVVDPSIDSVIRVTQFEEHRPGRGEYIYKVTFEVKDDGTVLKDTDRFPPFNQKVIYNYKDGTVKQLRFYEERPGYARGYGIVSKGDLDLYTFEFDGSPDNELHVSDFITKTYTASDGTVYKLISEKFVTGEPKREPVSYLMENNRLIAIREGTLIRRDIHERTLRDKFGASPVALGYRIAKKAVDSQADIRDLFARIEERGELVRMTPGGEIREKPIAVDWWRALVPYALLVMPALGLGVMAVATTRFKRKKRLEDFRKKEKVLKANGIKLMAPRGARLALSDADLIRNKVAAMHALGSAFTIPITVPQTEEAKENYVRNYFAAHGFEGPEVNWIAAEYKAGRMDFTEEREDPYEFPELGDADKADPYDFAQAASEEGHPKLRIIDELIQKELATREELKEAVREASFTAREGRLYENIGDALWSKVMKALIAKAQDRVFERIKKGGFEKGKLGELLASLPQTREADFLRYVLRVGILSEGQIKALAEKPESADFYTFIYQTLLADTLILPIFNQVYLKTFEGRLTNPKDLDFLKEGVAADLSQAILYNPSLLETLSRKTDLSAEDIVYNPYPKNKALEPVTLRELVLMKFVEFNLSQVGTPHLSLGQYSGQWSFKMYVVRQAKAALDKGGSVEEVKERVIQTIHELVSIIDPILTQELAKYDKRAKRKKGEKTPYTFEQLFIDTDLWQLFEYLAAKGEKLELAPLTALAQAGDFDGVARSLKETTKRLRAEIEPEVASADRGFGLRNFLWNRSLRSLFSKEFWEVNTARKAGLVLSAGLLIGLGLWIVPTSFAMGTMIMSYTFVLPILFGREASWKQKLFWLAVFGAAATFNFGFLTHWLFPELVEITLTFGTFLTAFFQIFSYPLTLAVSFQFGTSVKGYYTLGDDLWSDEARSFIGLRSLWPKSYPKKFSDWHREIRNAEKRRALTADGTGSDVVLADTVLDLEREELLSREETEGLLDFLADKPGAEFKRPESNFALEALIDAFMSLSYKKPRAHSYATFQPTTIHIQAFGERFIHTLENSIILGTFNPDPLTGRPSSYLGYMARTHKAEWLNFKKSLEKKLGGPCRELEDTSKWDWEWTNILELMSGRTKEEQAVIFSSMLEWLDSLRPNDHKVVQSMAKDNLHTHLFVSHEMGDLAYHKAVGQIAALHPSLDRAYEILHKKSEEGKALTKEEREFLRGFPRINPFVRSKYRMIYNGGSVWARDVEADYVHKHIKKINSLDKLVDLSDKIRNELNRPGVKVTNKYDVIRRLSKVVDDLEKLRHLYTDKPMSLDDWAEVFLQWRIDNALFLGQLLQDLRTPAISELFDNLIQTAETVSRCNALGVKYTFYEKKDVRMTLKNAAIATSLWKMMGVGRFHDAHFMPEYGQNRWIFNVLSEINQKTRPDVAALNPKMKAWLVAEDAFPVTDKYDISIRSWTGMVQRALRGLLTFYGKGIGLLQIISFLSMTGEDTAAFLALRRIEKDPVSGRYISRFPYTGTQVGYYTGLWGRPSVVQSIIGTEWRYVYNVFGFLRDHLFIFRAHSDMGFAKRLAHIMLWFTIYMIVWYSLPMIVIFPFLSAFTAFAALQPLIFFGTFPIFLMGISFLNNLGERIAQRGNFWWAVGKAFKDALTAHPMYVALQPNFARAGYLASNEISEFIRTIKDPLLQTEEQPKPLPLALLIAWGGVLSWTTTVLLQTPWGAPIALLYLFAALSMGGGHAVFKAYVYQNKLGERVLTGYPQAWLYYPLWTIVTNFGQATWESMPFVESRRARLKAEAEQAKMAERADRARVPLELLAAESVDNLARRNEIIAFYEALKRAEDIRKNLEMERDGIVSEGGDTDVLDRSLTALQGVIDGAFRTQADEINTPAINRLNLVALFFEVLDKQRAANLNYLRKLDIEGLVKKMSFEIIDSISLLPASVVSSEIKGEIPPEMSLPTSPEMSLPTGPEMVLPAKGPDESPGAAASGARLAEEFDVEIAQEKRTLQVERLNAEYLSRLSEAQIEELNRELRYPNLYDTGVQDQVVWMAKQKTDDPRRESVFYTMRDKSTGRLVAYAFGVPQERAGGERQFYIFSASVNPDYQKKGIGTYLHKLLLERAKEQGYTQAFAKVEPFVGRGLPGITRETPSVGGEYALLKNTLGAAVTRLYATASDPNGPSYYNAVNKNLDALRESELPLSDKEKEIERVLNAHPHAGVELTIDIEKALKLPQPLSALPDEVLIAKAQEIFNNLDKSHQPPDIVELAALIQQGLKPEHIRKAAEANPELRTYANPKMDLTLKELENTFPYISRLVDQMLAEHPRDVFVFPLRDTEVLGSMTRLVLHIRSPGDEKRAVFMAGGETFWSNRKARDFNWKEEANLEKEFFKQLGITPEAIEAAMNPSEQAPKFVFWDTGFKGSDPRDAQRVMARDFEFDLNELNSVLSIKVVSTGSEKINVYATQVRKFTNQDLGEEVFKKELFPKISPLMGGPFTPAESAQLGYDRFAYRLAVSMQLMPHFTHSYENLEAIEGRVVAVPAEKGNYRQDVDTVDKAKGVNDFIVNPVAALLLQYHLAELVLGARLAVSERIVVGIVSEGPVDFRRKQEALASGLGEQLIDQFEFQLIEAKNVEAFRNSQDIPFRVLIDVPAFFENMGGIITDLRDVLGRRQERLDKELAQDEKMVELIVKVFEGTATRDGFLKELHEIISELPPLEKATLFHTLTGLEVVHGPRVIPAGAFGTGISDRISQKVLDVMEIPDLGEASDLMKEALNTMMTHLGQPGGVDFAKHTTQIFDALQSRQAGIERALFEGAAVQALPGTYGIVTDSRVYLKDPAFYEGQMDRFDSMLENQRKAERLEGIHFRHILLVTGYKSLKEFSNANPEAAKEAVGRFGEKNILFAPRVQSVSEIQRLKGMEKQFVLITNEEEGIQFDKDRVSRKEGEHAALLQVDARAKSSFGVPLVAGAIALAPDKELNIPGLMSISRGVFRYLPKLYRLFEIVQRWKETRKAIGAAA